MRYYKAIRPDGTDFYIGTVQWAPAKTKARKGRVVKHPTSTEMVEGDWATGLAASTNPTQCPGAASWPLRILEVEPVGEVHHIGQKAQALAWRVVAEMDPAIRFGPQGAQVLALIEMASSLNYADVERLCAAQYAARDAAQYAARGAARDAAQYAARGAAQYAARDAARYAARYAARGAARYAAEYAARALTVRDLIGQHGFTQAHYDTLTGPWRTTIGPIHPDDKDVTA